MSQKPPRTIPVKTIATTALEVTGAGLLAVSGWLLVGLAGALAVAGAFCLAMSFAITRRP